MRANERSWYPLRNVPFELLAFTVEKAECHTLRNVDFGLAFTIGKAKWIPFLIKMYSSGVTFGARRTVRGFQLQVLAVYLQRKLDYLNLVGPLYCTIHGRLFATWKASFMASLVLSQ